MFLFSLPASFAAADDISEKALALDASIAEDGSSVRLTWPKAGKAKVERISVRKRKLGEAGKETWQTIALPKRFDRVHVDRDVRLGIAYEYLVSRRSATRTEIGYWVAGREVPAEEQRGVALLVVDSSIAKPLESHLDRFARDLIGDGWKVVRHDVPRGTRNKRDNLKAARKIRAWVEEQYYSDLQTPHALILIGHVPVVRSGSSNPDGHERVALATDLFYADMNGDWREGTNGHLQHNRIPSHHIEMQVGRIDFSSFPKTEELGDEISILKRYFDKNHRWRHGKLGDLRNAYGGKSNHLFVENNALRNIVGPAAVVKGQHIVEGKQQPWLFGVDFGPWKFSDYVDENPIKTIFSINFGSHKQKYSRNLMSAMLAQHDYGLVTGWGARPSWHLHHMALGKSMGYSHLRTVNNGLYSRGNLGSLEYSLTGNYTWINPIWVNLLGDPTLRPFPVTPVQNLKVQKSEQGVHLSWDPVDSENERGYRVYRSPNRLGEYELLNASELSSDNQFTDPEPISGAWYMVRARALQQVYAGSFYRFSQGMFVQNPLQQN